MLRFLFQPVDTIGVAGNAASLHCNVSGYAISSVLWYKNDGLILSDSQQSSSSDKDESKRETPQGIFITTIAGFGYWFSILNIAKLNVTDTGSYHCVATQEEELYITSNIAQLLVQCK